MSWDYLVQAIGKFRNINDIGVMVKGENCKICTFSTRHQTGFGLGFQIKVLTGKFPQILLAETQRKRVPSTVWTGMCTCTEPARNKPHWENTHGFTPYQSYNTTYKTHYKATTLNFDCPKQGGKHNSSSNQSYLIRNIPRDPTVSIPSL